MKKLIFIICLAMFMVTGCTSGNDNKGFNITMNDPHFENKGSEIANVSNIRRIVNSMK